MNNPKVTMNIAIDPEFRDWLGKFCGEVHMAMDGALVALALYGLEHLRECKQYKLDPVSYKHALEAQEKGEQR